MTAEQFPEDAHAKASSHILDSIQNLLDDGTIPGNGRVNSYITIAETINEEGKSQVQVLWSDDRTHMLLGLLSYGQIMVQMGMGGPPE